MEITHYMKEKIKLFLFICNTEMYLKTSSLIIFFPESIKSQSFHVLFPFQFNYTNYKYLKHILLNFLMYRNVKSSHIRLNII